MLVRPIDEVDEVTVTADSKCTLGFNLVIFIFIRDHDIADKSPDCTLTDLWAAAEPQYHQKLPTGFTLPTVFRIGVVL